MRSIGPRALALLTLAVAIAALAAGCGNGDATSFSISAQTPRRIVSLSPTATEDLFAIGAGDLVVAVDDQSSFPPQAPRTDLSGFQPNVEAIVSHRPDLVVMAGEGTRAAARGLQELGVRVLVQPAARTLSQAYAQIRQLGGITTHSTAAERVVARMRARIARALRAAPLGRGLSFYHELGPDYFSADSNTFIGRIYALFGLANVADAAAGAAGTGYPQLSAEHILAADPDLIVLADAGCCGQSAATVRHRPGWAGVAAVRRGGVVVVDEDVASRWGPRIPLFAEEIASAIRRVEGVRRG
ncbi:MAG TPA: helical backbone metal receptor [Solirubrobacterales bacterium]|nr:helical backbone metal receptor [Solirubrobacterales bacterium]